MILKKRWNHNESENIANRFSSKIYKHQNIFTQAVKVDVKDLNPYVFAQDDAILSSTQSNAILNSFSLSFSWFLIRISSLDLYVTQAKSSLKLVKWQSS